MPSHTDAFFEELAGRGHDPAFAGRTAIIRYEVTDDKRVRGWSVAIDKGDIAVSSPGDPADADCVLRANRELFDRIFSGETNSMAAMLRGELLVEGDPELLIATRGLLPASTQGGQS